MDRPVFKGRIIFEVLRYSTYGVFLTFLCDHGYHLQTNVLLHAESELPEGGDDTGDLLHHAAHVLPQLVHRDGAAHHGGEAGLEGHQVCSNLTLYSVKTS